MDKFGEPEQFDAEVEIHDGEPFAVWAPAVNGSHVKAEHYFALLAELEAKDKRIAELESVKADASQVFKEIGNELGCNPDNESIMMAIDELKKRLATPVRLPNKSDDEFWFDGVFQVAKFDRAVERAISAAGFKFAGEE